MEKGKQYGAFLAYDEESTPEIQLSIMAKQLLEIQDLFATPDFKGLTLADFKVEFIVNNANFYSDQDVLMKEIGIKVPEREPKHTIGWKITKKR